GKELDMEEKQVDPRTENDINSVVLISVLHAICVAMTPEQRKTVAGCLQQRAEHLASTALDKRALAAGAHLSALSLLASGQADDAAMSLEAMVKNLRAGPAPTP
ncbi:hypothetical protein, partial [Bordetella bronchiseptica]|uniref:hypothetical protein n=2 Tax=Bordetella bronchiseptica TaxID=518 RepID=UPI0039FD9B33